MRRSRHFKLVRRQHGNSSVDIGGRRRGTHFAFEQLETARDQFFWKRSSLAASTASCSCRACCRRKRS